MNKVDIAIAQGATSSLSRARKAGTQTDAQNPAAPGGARGTSSRIRNLKLWTTTALTATLLAALPAGLAFARSDTSPAQNGATDGQAGQSGEAG